MSTTIARAALVTMAAEELLIIDSGQSLEDEDRVKIDGRVDGLFGELSARTVCSVVDDDAIPIEWSTPLALLLANASATVFGRPRLPEADREAIEDRLRVMSRNTGAANRYLKGDRAVVGRGGYSLSQWRSGI